MKTIPLSEYMRSATAELLGAAIVQALERSFDTSDIATLMPVRCLTVPWRPPQKAK